MSIFASSNPQSSSSGANSNPTDVDALDTLTNNLMKQSRSMPRPQTPQSDHLYVQPTRKALRSARRHQKVDISLLHVAQTQQNSDDNALRSLAKLYAQKTDKKEEQKSVSPTASASPSLSPSPSPSFSLSSSLSSSTAAGNDDWNTDTLSIFVSSSTQKG